MLQVRTKKGGGYQVVGKDPQGRGVRISAKQRATAEHLRDVIAAGGETQVSDWDLDKMADGTLVEAPKRMPGEWVCPIHGTAHWVPAGVSKKTGKPYPAFRSCDARLPSGEWCPEAAPRVWSSKPKTVTVQARTQQAAQALTQQAQQDAQAQAAQAATPVQAAAKAVAQASMPGGTCRAFQPNSRMPGQAWGPAMGTCTRCGQDLQGHPSPIESRVSKSRGGRGAGLNAERTVFTVTHVESAHGYPTTLALGWECGKPGIPSAMVMDELAGAAIRTLLDDPAWEGGMVNVWADWDDLLVNDRTDPEVIRTLDNALAPAVYLGDDTGVVGFKPTLIHRQGVVILRTYQGTVEGDPLVQCDVLYDPTDERAGQCQWRQGVLITGVSRNDLSPNNWRTIDNTAQSQP